MGLGRGIAGVQTFKYKYNVRPAGASKWGVLQLNHRPLRIGDFFPADRLGVPEVIKRADSKAEMTRVMVFGPLEKDKAIFGVIADDLQRVAIARGQVAIRVGAEPDRYRCRPIERRVAEGLRRRELGADGAFAGEAEGAP